MLNRKTNTMNKLRNLIKEEVEKLRGEAKPKISKKEKERMEKEIEWIRNEVDFVPDDISVYAKWPASYRKKALNALKARKENWKEMVAAAKSRWE